MPSVPVLQLAIFSHCLVASAIREFDQKAFQVLQVDQRPRSDGSSQCTSASTLRAVLLQLGIPEEDLKNPHQARGITSNGCQVTEINFSGRELHGTLPQELGELQELKMLNLAETKVAGDLSTLKSATKLQGLNLGGTAVAGNLESLEKATKLQWLYLHGTAVAGNLKPLEKATELQGLDLRGTAVAGNLKSLEKATKLQWLYLSGTAVAGNLKSLEKATKLQWLYLSGTAVAGNLKSLEKATGLQVLGLQGTAVAGNLKSLLEQATQLQCLDLRGTAVAGNLKSLEQATQLQVLGLHGTAVAGNLKSLEKAAELQQLDLSGTAVAGNLKSLEKATELQGLDLRGTAVAGNLSVLLHFQRIEFVDLGRTQIHGSLSEAWRGGCRKLRSLTLSDTLATFLPANDDLQELWKADNVESEKALLPNLQYLEVNNIPMNGLAERFLTILSACGSLSTIKASNCSLNGTVPNLGNLAVKVDGLLYLGWVSSLSESLQNLDLGANDISEVSSLPMKIQSLSLAKMNTGVHFQKGVLRDASSKKILLDLSGVRLMNSSEAANMLQHEELRSTSQFTMIDKTKGFQCKDLEGSSLRVTPHMFLPNELCQCLVGWIGTGAACRKCPKDTFRDTEVPSTADACTPCPLNSTSKEASGILTDCQCNLGHLFQMGEEWRCGCPPDHALVEDACDKCELLHLDCLKNGSQASTAPAKEGYARLSPKEPRAFKCYPPLERCNATRSGVRDEVGCNKGYSGILCSECAATYRKDGDRCKECPKNLNSWWFWVGLVGFILVVLGLGVAFRRGAEVQHVAPLSAVQASKDLAMAQAPILLQSCQLWPVLAHLARSVKTDTTEPSEMWWMKYIEVLQFSAETFKGSLNLQCHHDGRTVRFMFAVLGPVLPLLMMMACIFMEKFQKGAGLRTSLKILTLTYIGGAAACSNLLPCQNFDANGIELTESFIFRKHLPSIKCSGSDASMRFYVDTVAYATGLFYAIVIPGFLAYLFAKTQFMLRPARTSVAVASDRHELKVSMSKIIDSSDLERDAAERRLVASTMAYIAVVVRGRVRIQLLRDELTVHVKPVEGQSHRLDQDGLESADSFDLPFAMEEVTVATALKCRGISEMLMERCILEEVEDSDRILAGAKQLLLKYAQGSYLCMEILLKLAAVAVVTLVQTVQDESAVKLCVGVTLATAATIGLAQPYLQPQLNSLQVVCFTSLSISGLGFACGQVWLSQIALFLPFIVAGWQLMTPDSSQSLALRLWNEAKKLIPRMQKGEEIEVIAEIFTFR